MSAPIKVQVDKLAQAIARKAITKRYPLKSMVAQLRRLHLEPGTSLKVKLRAIRILNEQKGAVSGQHDVSRAPWLSLVDAAEVLAISASLLQSRLKLARYRRLYGWPWHDGHRWHIPAQALAPDTRASFLAAQPSDEPHSDLLPEWCNPE